MDVLAKHRSIALMPFVLLLALASPASAQSRGKGKAKDKTNSAVEVMASVTFTQLERAEIERFYRDNASPGLESLPPGIRKNLARGKPLPPGIAKQVLPPTLEGMLPSREGYRRLAVGADIILIEIATGLIVDILADVIL
jgi:hypothetical protein